MNIALLGYGKMGKIIESIAKERGHQVSLKVGRKGFASNQLQGIDVAIDFSLPSTAFKNITSCLEANVPVVSGTTGWLDKYAEVVKLCEEKNGSFFYASNFSLGVNLFFELNKQLAKMMNGHAQYKPSLLEIHHTQKLDAPSGTAITLAEGILNETDEMDHWKYLEDTEEVTSKNELAVRAERIDPTPGTHVITFDSDIDSIEIKHTAKNRKGFALGAVIAAEYLTQNPGVRSMRDVLGLH